MESRALLQMEEIITSFMGLTIAIIHLLQTKMKKKTTLLTGVKTSMDILEIKVAVTQATTMMDMEETATRLVVEEMIIMATMKGQLVP